MLSGNHNFRRGRAGRVCAAGLALGLAVPAAALADRHCFPASEDYYMARQVLLAEDAGPDAVPDALARLEAAAGAARDCGCADLRAVLEDVLHEARGAAPDARATAILSAEEIVDAAVARCHE